MYNNEELTENAPVMSYWERGGWEAWFRERATPCMRGGIAGVGEIWGQELKGAKSRPIPETFALRSGIIGGATRLGRDKGAPEHEKKRRKVIAGRAYGIR